MALFAILHNIRSAHNVGSIFRTADGAGVEKLFLSGYTPTPVDRFGRVVDEILKTSLGATESVAWEHVADTLSCVESLQARGVTVVVLEQHARAVPYTTFHGVGDIALVVGNEIDGVPASVCEAANAVLEIPMHGMKESLNVSVATGIALFHLHEGQGR